MRGDMEGVLSSFNEYMADVARVQDTNAAYLA